MTAVVDKVRPRKMRRRSVDVWRAVAALLIVAGVVAGAVWLWQNFGTSIVANRREAATLAAFDAAHPRVERVAELHDVDNAPTTDLAGAWGTLWVPSWAGRAGVHGDVGDGRTPIKEGVTPQVLKTGSAGHFPTTVMPGQLGNSALAGHRRTYGDNFLHVNDLTPGDVVVVETGQAWFVYEVALNPYVVEPEAGEQVLADAPAGLPEGGRYLTLVSCHSVTEGAWGNDHRIIVHAKMLGWLPHDAGIPPQLAGLA